MKNKSNQTVNARTVKVGDTDVEVFGDATDAEVKAWAEKLENAGDGKTADEILKGAGE